MAVPEDLTFRDLHEIIQAVMPWEDEHLHIFEIPGTRMRIGSDDRPRFRPEDCEPESESYVAGLHGVKFRYLYDFGDCWYHDITWLKDIEGDVDVPRVLKYTEECPPEDCGGIWGYYGYLDVLSDPDAPGYESAKEWWGDPEPYDMDDVNLQLEVMYRHRRRRGDREDRDGRWDMPRPAWLAKTLNHDAHAPVER